MSQGKAEQDIFQEMSKPNYFTLIDSEAELLRTWTFKWKLFLRQILQLYSVHECPGICECPKFAEKCLVVALVEVEVNI